MATFTPDTNKPIVWNWIHRDLEIDSHEIQAAIEYEQDLEKTDLRLGFGGVAVGTLTAAAILALAGIGFAMVPPIGLAIAGGFHGYNAGIQGRRRELEGEFLDEHPGVLTAIENKLNQGEGNSKVASAYEATFRAYRRGDDAAIAKVLGQAQSQSAFQPTNDQDANRYIPESSAVTELQPIAAAPSFTSPNLTPPKTRSELIARLKQDCPLLLKLVKSHPIRAVGVQRSGKTTLVKRLTLLRMALMENHRVVASSPHYEAANQYPDVFDVVGLRNGKRDYPAIERAWYQMASDVEACNMANITYVWDEFGLQDKAIPITPENDPIKTVLTSCLRETMKFQIYPIFILHGETAAFLPGSKGLVTVILASTVRVETIGEAVEGDDGLEMIRPTGRFNVTWLDGSKGEGILPAWLSEDFLLEMIGPRSIPVVKTSTATSSATIAHLENAYQAPAVEVDIYEAETVKPTPKFHPYQEEFNKIESLLEGEDSLTIRALQRALTCDKDKAVQLAQMFCLSQKSRYKFVQSPNTNGTVSKSIERVGQATD